MWKCKHCNSAVPFSVAPAIDKHGIHFICPHCQDQNILINVGDEHTELMQPDIDWDEFKKTSR